MSKHVLVDRRGRYLTEKSSYSVRLEDAKIYANDFLALRDAIRGEVAVPLWKLQRNDHARK